MLTNEEERVALYSRADLTTVPSEVTKDTNLENLNLNWREKELPEKERTKHVHRLHPYLGKFIPQLVEIFLRKYFSPGQTVLDPFCGSGTTLVQANELGINSIGYDVSAFNVLLTRTKTAKYDLVKVRKEVMDIFNKTRDISQPKSQQLCIWEESSPTWLLKETDDPYLQQWFAPQARRELLVYRQLIESEGYEYQSLLKIILSRSARSARLTTHFDLDFPKNPQTEPYWCYKHSRLCQPTTEALKFLKRYSLDTIKRLEEFSVRRTDAVAIACHADSRKTAPPPIDGVITSPPYVGLIDYHEQHAYAYHLLGLEDKREREIGAAANGSSQKAQRQYQQDISEVFRNALDSMPAGSRLIVIAGDKANLYGQIADFIGVEVEAIVQRHVNRRTGRRSGEFYESVFIWRKR
ncbi:class I SAM-dependent methyltransferase [Microcoleus sp. FACHB-831]|uniref:DNA methyltransferase n=1 Tax=Microcoleus sp. FACHB-831 TaxID=2692827 RepID=UPI001686353D|nr:DNA methyltransferase [Microcoleus sp. FACHB-831]MBD1921840.1 class I SAM-dependent methyltransferase [Microcoleus sp. FACHB-831]